MILNDDPKLPVERRSPTAYRLEHQASKQVVVVAGADRLVRDQEVGGSNPLAPTNLFNSVQASDAKTALPFTIPLGICSIESKVRILRPWRKTPPWFCIHAIRPIAARVNLGHQSISSELSDACACRKRRAGRTGLFTLEDERNAMRAVKRCRFRAGTSSWVASWSFPSTRERCGAGQFLSGQSLSASVSGRAPLVAVMEAADLGNRHDSSGFGRPHCPRLRRVLR
jgi:hypothetical protein